MLRRWVAIFLLSLSCSSLGFATGIGGDSPPARIPVPAKLFSAEAEDQSGNSVQLTRVSFNGEVFVYGEFGSAMVTIPFEKLDRIDIESTPDKEKYTVLATLKDGTSVRVAVDHDLLCYGATNFGNYQIAIEDLRRIQFPKSSP